MSDRSERALSFLEENGFQNASLVALAGDASARRYFRFAAPSGEALILMDAPPEKVSNTGAFVELSDVLRRSGLVVPEIIAKDLTSGFLVLSDLGAQTARRFLMDNPDAELEIYSELLHANFLVEDISFSGLNSLTAQEAGLAVEITAKEYAGRPDLSQDLSHLMRDAFETHCRFGQSLALRDYHAENAIWRPEKIGPDRLGLLDYQDAFYAPKGYDLASMLRDVRYEVSQKTADVIYSAYVAEYELPTAFIKQYQCLSIQRNLRILGIFAKLGKRPRTSRYLKYLDRTWSLLSNDLRNEGFEQLQKLVRDEFPDPADFVASASGKIA